LRRLRPGQLAQLEAVAIRMGMAPLDLDHPEAVFFAFIEASCSS